MFGFLRFCLPLLLLASIATPGSAQLLDPPVETSTEPADREEAQAPAPERAPSKRRLWRQPPPETPGASSYETDREPPLGIARLRRSSEPEPAEAPAPAVEERSQVLALFLSLLGVGLFLFIVERARSWITTNIPLRRGLGGLVFVLRITGFGLLLAIAFALLPGSQNWILWALAALALVVGWSVRDLFADLVAGMVLAAERRVKKGMWVSGDGFQGTVEGRSLRATWLRDGQGHRLTVPNRAMVGAPMIYDAGADAEHEVVVRLEGYDDAGKVRMALTDAILSSPWVLAGASPVVLRDPADPVVWRVRSKLLEPRFSVHFEGELLERVEDLLRYEPKPTERETPSSDVPAES